MGIEEIEPFVATSRKKIYVFNTVPVAKPRMTRSDIWKRRPVVMKYRAFADELRYQANAQKYKLKAPVDVTFVIPFPKTYSMKKKIKMEGQPHIIEKFDIDNLIKAFCDALTDKDGHIWSIRAEKIWGHTGKIIVREYDY